MYGGVNFAAGNDNNNDLYYLATIQIVCRRTPRPYLIIKRTIQIMATGLTFLLRAVVMTWMVQVANGASTVTKNGYGYMEGTSMATPMFPGGCLIVSSSKNGFHQ
jgi:hypothetical protein